MSSREEGSTFNSISTILRQIAIYANDLSQTLGVLGHWEDGLKTEEDVRAYVKDTTLALYKRLCEGDKRFFPDASDYDIREELCGSLREIFEKTPSKIILSHEDKEGTIKVHPLFGYLYDGLIRDKPRSIIVNSGPISISFDSIYAEPENILDELFIAFNPTDMLTLFNWQQLPSDFEQNGLRTNYRIKTGQTVVFNVEKPKVDFPVRQEEKKSSFPTDAQIVEQNLLKRIRELQEAGPKSGPTPLPKAPTLLNQCKTIRGLLGYLTPSNRIGLETLWLAVHLMRFGDQENGKEAIKIYNDINDHVKPERTLKEPDLISHEVSLIVLLDKIERGQEGYQSDISNETKSA